MRDVGAEILEAMNDEENYGKKLWRMLLLRPWKSVGLLICVILAIYNFFTAETPREMNMYDALIDGIETHMGIKAKNIQWENVHFPLTSEDNKNWIESNKSPQAVEDTVRSKLEGFTVSEKGKTLQVVNAWDLWIHTKQFDVRVKINTDSIIAFYNSQIAIEYEIK